MKYLDEFRDGAKAGFLLKEIEGLTASLSIPDDRPLQFMEVCGGHTHSIFRYGVEGLLPRQIELAFIGPDARSACCRWAASTIASPLPKRPASSSQRSATRCECRARAEPAASEGRRGRRPDGLRPTREVVDRGDDAARGVRRLAALGRERQRGEALDAGRLRQRVRPDLPRPRSRDAGVGITTERLEEWIEDFQAERRISAAEARKRRAAGARFGVWPTAHTCSSTPASSRTKRKYLVNLNGVMKRAMKLGAITSNPVTLVDRPGRVRKQRTLATTQFLRPAEVHALVRAAAEGNGRTRRSSWSRRSAACASASCSTCDGARSTSRALRSTSSPATCAMRRAPEVGRGAHGPMAAEVAQALAELLQEGPARSEADLVFVGGQGRHVDGNALRKRYYAALERAASAHQHSRSEAHLRNGLRGEGHPQTTIKEWMGHSDLATTEIYTAFYPQEADAARISAAFAEEPGVQLAGVAGSRSRPVARPSARSRSPRMNSRCRPILTCGSSPRLA